MLADRAAEQEVLFREITLKRLTVRDTESIARRIAYDRVRKKEYLYSPEILNMERELTEALGTRVAIETKEHGGKLSIDFMSEDDLRVLFAALAARIAEGKSGPEQQPSPLRRDEHDPNSSDETAAAPAEAPNLDDRSKEETTKDENTFDPNSFSL
jgi:hypothetical protein